MFVIRERLCDHPVVFKILVQTVLVTSLHFFLVYFVFLLIPFHTFSLSKLCILYTWWWSPPKHVAVQFMYIWILVYIYVHPREVCLYWMLYVVACKLQIIPGITSFLRNTKQYNLFSNSAFKIVSLCKHTLLPASVKFLETILFSSSVAFLMMSVASQKCRLFNVDFSRWKMHKISCRQGRREWDMLQCSHVVLC